MRRLDITTPQDIYAEIVRLRDLAMEQREHSAKANYQSLLRWLTEPIHESAPSFEELARKDGLL